jgi:hypothetical protein
VFFDNIQVSNTHPEPEFDRFVEETGGCQNTSRAETSVVP